MNQVIVLLFVFLTLGLFEHRLGRRVYAVMALFIALYIAYAYHYG